ncbi:MAG: antibiotic biosynthesis monooxygenase [Actinomycetota bacterium]|nr:antibiotic biosynthesis monooxygenase [Actinomycetota bacterium]
MIAIMNSLPVNEGAADAVVERFAGSRGHVQDFPRFVSMEVLKSAEGDEVLVVTRWRNRAAFDAWVGSEECFTPSALAVPRLTVTAVR